MDILIHNASVICGAEVLPSHSVLCRDGKIEAVLPDGMLENADVSRFDANAGFLAPGFIDMHFHGARMELAERGPESLKKLCDMLPEFGVTGFLPTIAPLESANADIETLKALAAVKSPLILGFFLEGHYLSLTGALILRERDMSMKRVESLITAALPHKIVFAVSPELEGIMELLPAMTSGGFPAFITHTRADSSMTEKAISLGARHATHFYDVFPYPGEKEPGVRGCGAVEAVMASPDASVDFILDGEHVEPIAVKMALACKGFDKVCLITDANVCAGMPSGRYSGGFSGIEVYSAYPGGPARILGGKDNGALAGSGLTMDLAVRNAVSMLGLSLPQAAAMASANPAKVLGLKNKGRLEAGYDADITLLDASLSVSACWVAGECRYTAKK